MKAFIFTYVAEVSRGANHEQILLLLEPTKQQTILARKAPCAVSESGKDGNRKRSKEQRMPKIMWIFVLMKGSQLHLYISTWVVPWKVLHSAEQPTAILYNS